MPGGDVACFNTNAVMRNVYQTLAELQPEPGSICLATLVLKTGSAPQVPGSSALITTGGITSGTLGGGILEAGAIKAAVKALNSGKSSYIEFELNEDISIKGGAICGGKAGILIDASPVKHLDEYQRLSESLRKGIPGIMITAFRSEQGDRLNIFRYWRAENEKDELPRPIATLDTGNINVCITERKPMFTGNLNAENSSDMPAAFFLEPFYPLPRLIIAGAGHIGKALTHQASLLDFDVRVVDDRPDLANQTNLPEAGEIIVEDAANYVSNLAPDENTYIVIVTRGHAGDAEVLKACISKPVAYIGMIGSRRKTRLMMEQFLEQGWATPKQWERVHAPIGLDIGSTTIQEIAVSIAAELVFERRRNLDRIQCKQIWALVLAAGESKRMGTPKMLLSYDESTIIETVIDRIGKSQVRKTMVVIGAEKEAISKHLSGSPVEICENPRYMEGMFSSVHLGFQMIPAEADAIMVFLGDQPMIRPELIDMIIESWKHSGKGIVVPVHHKRRGHPVLIDAKYREAVNHLDPEKGLRMLLTNYSHDVLELDTKFSSVLRDIDTASDYQREMTWDQS